MIDHYFTAGGSCIAFFCTQERIASICITRTEYQVSIVRTQSDTPDKLARWMRHSKVSKDHFFKIYFAATSINNPGAQKSLDLLTPAACS